MDTIFFHNHDDSCRYKVASLLKNEKAKRVPAKMSFDGRYQSMKSVRALRKRKKSYRYQKSLNEMMSPNYKLA